MKSKLENGSDTNDVFNDAVVQLDNYGLLKGISVKGAQELVNKPISIKSLNNDVKNNKKYFMKISDIEKTSFLELPSKISSFNPFDSTHNKTKSFLPKVIYGTAIIINGDSAANAIVEINSSYGSLKNKVLNDGSWQVDSSVLPDGTPFSVIITKDKWQGVKNDTVKGILTNVGEIILDAIIIAADIRFDDDCYLVDEMIQFYGDIYGEKSPFKWFWDFDDGSISTEQNPIHKFNSAGYYNISLTVSDKNGNTDTDIVPIEIYSTIQVYPSYEDNIYYPDDSVQFYGDVCGGDPWYTWFWDFGDGGISYNRNPVHQFKSGGIFNVSLTVTDGNGRINSGYVDIEITPFIEIVGTAVHRFYGSVPFCDKIVEFLFKISKLFDPTGDFVERIYSLISKVEDLCFIYNFFKSFLIPIYQSADISIGSAFISYEEIYDKDWYPSNGWVWINKPNIIKTWEGDLFGTLSTKVIYDWYYGSLEHYIGVEDFNGLYIEGKYFGNCLDVGIREGHP